MAKVMDQPMGQLRMAGLRLTGPSLAGPSLTSFMVTGLMLLTIGLGSSPALAQMPPSIPAQPAIPDVVTRPVAPATGPSAPLPGFPGTGPARGVVDDPSRIFGDDALDPVGLDLLGAVIGGFGLSFGAAVSTEYNSNFARLQGDEPLPGAFESKSDWRVTPIATGEIARPIGRQRIFARGRVGYDFFLRNSNFNRARLGIDGGLDWRLGSRCSGLVSGGWGRRAVRATDFAQFTAGNQASSNYGVTAGCSLASGLGFNAGVQRDFLRNEQDFRQFADVDSTAINGSVFYAIGQRGNVSINGFLASNEFPGQLLPDGSTNGLDIKGLSLGATYSFGQNLRANLQLGRSWIDPENPLGESTSGTTWTLGLTYAGPRLGANLSYSRNFAANRAGFIGAQQVTSYLASVTYRANEQLNASAGFARARQDFGIVNDVIGPVPQFDVTDNRFFVGANYDLNRLLSLSADVNHVKRKTTPPQFGFDMTRVGLTLRARI